MHKVPIQDVSCFLPKQKKVIYLVKTWGRTSSWRVNSSNSYLRKLYHSLNGMAKFFHFICWYNCYIYSISFTLTNKSVASNVSKWVNTQLFQISNFRSYRNCFITWLTLAYIWQILGKREIGSQIDTQIDSPFFPSQVSSVFKAPLRFLEFLSILDGFCCQVRSNAINDSSMF